MKCRLYSQIPMHDHGVGYVNMDNNGNSAFFCNNVMQIELYKTKIELIGEQGINLSGMEPTAPTTSKQKYTYQEWYIIPLGEQQGFDKENK